MAGTVGSVLINVGANTAQLIAGMTKAQQQMNNSVRKMQKSLGLLTRVFAVVGGTAGVGMLVKSSIDLADKTGKLAEKLQMSSEELSKLAYAGKFAAVDMGTLDSALSAMIRRTNNFARDGSGAAKRAMESLGISAQFAKKNFTSTEKTFKIIVDRLSKMPNSYQKTAIAQDIFSKSASTIVRLANLGSEGLKKLGEEAQRTGNVISSEFASDSANLNDQLETLKLSFGGIVNKLVREVTPALITGTKAIEGMIGVQREETKYELFRDKEKILKDIEDITSKIKNNKKHLEEYYKIPERQRQAFSLGITSIKMDINNEERLISSLKKKLKPIKEQIKKIKDAEKLKNEASKNFVTKNTEENAKKLALLKYEKTAKDVNKKILDEYAKLNLDEYNIKRYNLRQQFFQDLKYADDVLKVNKVYATKLKQIDNEEKEDKQKKLDEFNDAYAKATLTQTQYSIRQLNEERKIWATLTDDKIKIAKLYNEKYKKLVDNSLKYQTEPLKTWQKGAKASFDAYVKNATNSYRQANEFFTNSMKNMEDMLVDFVTKGKLNFSDFANSIARDMARIAIQRNITAPLYKSMFPEDEKGGIFKWFSGLFNAHGNAFVNGQVQAFANGGIVNQATLFGYGGGLGVMGEAGTEAILPLGRIGADLGVKSVPSRVTLNITNNGGSPISSEQISEMTKTNANGEAEKVINIVIDGVTRNKNGIRDVLRGII